MSHSKNMATGTPYHSVSLGNEHTGYDCGYQEPSISYKQIAKATGKKREIAFNAFFLTTPMLILTTILFAFVFGYRIDLSDAPFPNLRGNESAMPTNDAYYVDLNSTFLIFLASWMSSLAPMLAGFAITLAAFPIAGRFFEDSVQQNRERLLTPFQLNLTLKLVNGSTWSGLWSLILYRLGWGKRVQSQGAALVSLFRITIVIVLLSTLVLGADTWLHVVTKTVGIIRLSPLEAQEATYSLSLLSPNCTATNNTIAQLAENELICTMDPGTALLKDGTAVMRTLNNQSNAISVFNNGPDPTYSYLSLSSSERDSKHDFTATTIGMHAGCKPITQACNMRVAQGLTVYDCANGSFTNNMTGHSFDYAYFGTEDMSDSSAGGSENPFYVAFASISTVAANSVTDLADDPEIVSSRGMMGVILLCTISLHDVEYDLVDGNVTRFQTTPSNTSVANVFQPGMSEADFGLPNLENAMKMAAVVATDAQDLANQYAIAYAKVALSIGAGSFVRSPAVAAQDRSTVLVAKVPKAPLFLLVVINLIFIVMGAVLAIMAARTSQEAYEVQSRFSIAGIVANMFEGEKASRPAQGVERLYGEYWVGHQTSRVAIHRTSTGGFVFRALDKEMDGIAYQSRD